LYSVLLEDDNSIYLSMRSTYLINDITSDWISRVDHRDQKHVVLSFFPSVKIAKDGVISQFH
jgi:hypothetical protein